MESFNRNLKIVTSNFSGNVGKSVVSQHLFFPRIPNSELISVESINAGSDGDVIRAEHFVKIIERVMLAESAIIDVGASNIEEFIIRMNQQEGVHEEIDYFAVPLTKEEKQQEDTIRTIQCYKALGVPSDKIIIIFNMIKPTDNIQEVFSSVIQAANDEGIAVNLEAKMEFNEFYQKLKQAGLSVSDIKNDTTDYHAKIKQLKNEAARIQCIQMITLHRLYAKSAPNLDVVFSQLFGKAA